MKPWIGCFRRHAIRAIAVFAVALAMPATTHAGLYKCLRDDGSVMYQEDACPPGKELRDFGRDPAPVSVVPFRIPPSDAKIVEPRELPLPKTSERKSSKSANRQGNAAERKFLVPGIGEGEVVARVGRPDLSSGAGRKVVKWTYLPAPDDPQTITTLTFELGRLVQVERKVIHTP
ncbi:MAG TPA: DUF4124 domain-containing protein [Casimicrobiaceae bacterium]|nr:DUF4124 domain-containing protein [Casimicrobiaceae bacterium]